MDIGPATSKRYGEIIAQAKTILWNGPDGIVRGQAIRRRAPSPSPRPSPMPLPSNGAKSIIGGGDSVKALNQAGLADKVTFMSTGGGASLEFLEGRVLPGVAALTDK